MLIFITDGHTFKTLRGHWQVSRTLRVETLIITSTWVKERRISGTKTCFFQKVHLWLRWIICLRKPTQRKQCCRDQIYFTDRNNQNQQQEISRNGKQQFCTRQKKTENHNRNLVFLSKQRRGRCPKASKYLCNKFQCRGQFSEQRETENNHFLLIVVLFLSVLPTLTPF